MMRNEPIPPVGAQIGIHRISAGVQDLMPAKVVAHLLDPVLGNALELRPLGTSKTMQRVWPSPTLKFPLAS